MERIHDISVLKEFNNSINEYRKQMLKRFIIIGVRSDGCTIGLTSNNYLIRHNLDADINIMYDSYCAPYRFNGEMTEGSYLCIVEDIRLTGDYRCFTVISPIYRIPDADTLEEFKNNINSCYKSAINNYRIRPACINF